MAGKGGASDGGGGRGGRRGSRGGGGKARGRARGGPLDFTGGLLDFTGGLLDFTGGAVDFAAPLDRPRFPGANRPGRVRDQGRIKASAIIREGLFRRFEGPRRPGQPVASKTFSTPRISATIGIQSLTRPVSSAASFQTSSASLTSSAPPTPRGIAQATMAGEQSERYFPERPIRLPIEPELVTVEASDPGSGRNVILIAGGILALILFLK